MTELHFAAPWWLALSGLAVVGAWLAWQGARRRAAAARAFVRHPRRGPEWATGALVALAVAGASVAAARPQWGTVEAELPRRAVDIVYVVDVSRSMGASDVRPSRMAAAKEAVAASFERLRDVRVGLVVFAGTARTRFPLTADLAAAAAIVRSLEPGQVIVGPGTSVAAGLEQALALFPEGSEAGRLVVLVTDGDDLGPEPAGALAALRAAGVELLVAGVGTPEGGEVPVYDRRLGEWTTLREPDGTPVVTQLDERFLASVANLGGGEYVGAELSLLPTAVRARAATLRTAEVERRTLRFPVERFHLFAASALGLLLALWASEGVLRRWRRTALLLALLPALLAGAACASTAHRLNEEGVEAFAAGEYERAVDRFRAALAEDPTNDRLALNLAAALHAAGRYDEATLAARRAANAPDPEIRALAQLFLGHHAFAQGSLEDALEALKRSLLERPSDQARHDFEVVYALLRTPESGSSAPTRTPTASPSPGGSPTPTTQTEDSPGGGGPGTPQPQPGGTATPAPGGGGQALPSGEAAIADRIAAIDREVAAILEAAAGNLTASDVERILDLLAERERLGALRGALGGAADPNDY